MDGIYHHRLALRHKEILDALERGITVLGAASIGALRAAELDRFGMIGVGRVYHWYRTGVFDGDDAVSVAHSETGSPAGINVPLVNAYGAVLAACDAGVLRQEASRTLMARLEREYYPLRTSERVLAVARECGESAFADWYGEQVAADPGALDQKQTDALEALALAGQLDTGAREKRHDGSREERHEGARTGRRDGARAGRPGTAAPAAQSPAAPGDRDWRTEYHRRWRNRFATAAPDLHHRLAYQQIFDPGFPDVWWDYLHGSSDPVRPAAPDGFRGHVLRHLGPAAAQWLDDPRLRSRVTAVLCPLPDLADPRAAGLLLRRESAQDRDRVADWLARTRRHLDAHPGRSLGQIGEAVCTRLLARIWGVGAGEELTAECGRRGLPSLHQAARALRPFAIGYLSGLQEAHTSGGRGHV
ncbi:TfuA-like protein [Streptomyces sp. MMG1533]|uniref:TfuA-like protein n=1 Tax=Streptomyces sp. MMG1533 TaxID=1415546 RepID=UPI0006AD8FCF|nr:TfuA-like protein [Streptomyces sp. MMG1533]